jgi:murein DD-endopeptidase MepM/ murein hydrolase activator NlpD
MSLLAVVIAGCQTSSASDKDFSIIVGLSTSGSEIMPCNDYASRTSYSGAPYRIKNPETGKITDRHKGMDFCAPKGTPVIASADGKIAAVVMDNKYRGGRVIIKTGFRAKRVEELDALPIFLDFLHIVPDSSLRFGDLVKAGDIIGWVQEANRPEIGYRSHVHFTAGTCFRTWECHTDPNRFWAKGAGIITCFDPESPPIVGQITAPLTC